MTALVLHAATSTPMSLVPTVAALDGLDPEALSAVADALLAANEAAPVLPRDVEAPVEAEVPAARPRLRRSPVDCSPEALVAREAMIMQHMPLVRYVANSMSRHAGQSVLLDYDD